MKKIFMMAAVALMSLSAFAQQEAGTISLQPKIGINMASLTGDYGSDKKMKVGMTLGVEGLYQMSDKFGISAGINYSMQGVKVSSDKYKLNYLNIPILANYYVISGLAVKAGIQPGFLLGAKYEDTDIKDDCKKMDFAIPVGVSYEFSNIVIDARYNIGLTNVWDDSYDSSKNSVFQLTVGYKFSL